ncbi:MAG TPA: 50S ribosomal protein L3 [Pirellulales bacterium]|jgi:large subunit ribosomal protein L3|nr:50S ribosomal protein L3 [Pirellulales bacterium]
MAIGLLGRKVGMTQIFNEAGEAIPVTVIEAGPCHVLQLRTTERDGYEAVQVGFLDKPRRLAARSERGHVAKLDSKRSKARSKAGVELLAKADCEPKRLVREFRIKTEGYTVGQLLDVSVFAETKAVDVTGTTKGRGTTGVMKRHNFHGQRATHGVKKCHRHGGSVGMNTFPHRTFKGKRMAGRYGNERVTTRNIDVVRVDKENNLLLIHGPVPGPIGGYVVVNHTNKLT